MTRNSQRGLLVLILIVLVFNLIAFVVPFEKTPMFWLGYAFGMISILFQAYIFKLSFFDDGDAKSRFFGFPIARVGVYYLVIQLIVSIMEMAIGVVFPFWAVLIVNVLILVLAVIGCITTDAMRDEIVRQDVQLKKDVSCMRNMQSLANALISQCPEGEIKKSIQTIVDELRFSDPVSSDATKEIEEELQNQIARIQQAMAEDDTVEVTALIKKFRERLLERNRICYINK